MVRIDGSDGEMSFAARIMAEREKLPELCRDCDFRPRNTGGSGACDVLHTVRETFVGIKNLSESEYDRDGGPNVPGMLRINIARAVKPDGEGVLRSDLASVGDFARSEAQRIDDVFTADGIGTTEDTPSPHGEPVEICINSLRALIDNETARKGFEAIDAAATAIVNAREAGVATLFPPSTTQ